jgi:type VI secretion system secreted protein Hcp
MRRFRAVPGSLAALAVTVTMTAPVPSLAQTVTRGEAAPQAGRVSKVDAITIKQTTAAAYMKLGEIKGEAVHDRHKGEIEVLSWSWGASQAQGRARPPRGSGTLTITKAVDNSSPALADASRNRRRFQQLTLTLPPSRAGETEVVVTLADVAITAIQRTDDGARPTESISFNYRVPRTRLDAGGTSPRESTGTAEPWRGTSTGRAPEPGIFAAHGQGTDVRCFMYPVRRPLPQRVLPSAD